MKNSTAQFQGQLPGPGAARRGVQRRRWRGSPLATASPTAPTPTLTEKNINTGFERTVHLDTAGLGSGATPTPSPPVSPLASLKSFFLPQGWPDSVSQVSNIVCFDEWMVDGTLDRSVLTFNHISPPVPLLSHSP